MEYIKVNNITKSFKSIEIFNDIDFKINKSQIVSILGPSGCGKSTILKIISGLEKPSTGDITLNGTSIIGNTGICSLMSQENDLLEWRTLFQNLILPLELEKVSKKNARQIAMEHLKRFGLFDSKDLYPSESSGGMNQRINLLRTFLMDREIVLLDEPFSKIDHITKIDLMNYLIKLWKVKKSTIVMVTHDIDEALYLSDEIIILSKQPTKIKKCICIDEINKNEDYLSSPDYLEKRKMILDLLRS